MGIHESGFSEPPSAKSGDIIRGLALSPDQAVSVDTGPLRTTGEIFAARRDLIMLAVELAMTRGASPEEMEALQKERQALDRDITEVNAQLQ